MNFFAVVEIKEWIQENAFIQSETLGYFISIFGPLVFLMITIESPPVKTSDVQFCVSEST